MAKALDVGLGPARSAKEIIAVFVASTAIVEYVFGRTICHHYVDVWEAEFWNFDDGLHFSAMVDILVTFASIQTMPM
jgi:hypothetical protein